MKKLSILLLVAVFAVAGCATVTFTETGSVPTDEPYKKRWAHQFLNAFGPNKVDPECPAGQELVASEVRFTGLNWLVAVFTFTIYSPRTIKYWCE